MKKLFVFLILGLFLISLAAAFEFDNVKQYDIEKSEITIKNSILGISFLDLDTVAKIKLNTPHHNYVSICEYFLEDNKTNDECEPIAEFELNVYEDYELSFKELELYNKKDNDKKFARNYDYKYKTIGDVVVNDYEEQCTKEGCEYVVAGNHIEKGDVWVDVKDYNFVKDTKLTIGIFMDIEQGDHIEWVPNYFGVRIEEWAEVEGNYIGKWALNVANTNSYGLATNNSHVWVTDNTDAEVYVYLIDGTYLGSWDTSGELAKPTAIYIYDGFIWVGANAGMFKYSMSGVYQSVTWSPQAAQATVADGCTDGTNVNLQDHGDDVSYAYLVDGTEQPLKNFATTNAAVPIGCGFNETYIWISEVGTQDMEKYLRNGTWVSSFDLGSSGMSNALGMGIAENNTAATFFITDSTDNEVYMFYAYHIDNAIAPAVTLTSPADDANITAMPLNLVASATDAIKVDNVTLYIDEVLNITNTSGVNGTYTFPVTLNIGVHNWSILAWNNNSLSNQSATRTFNFTGLAPVISLTTPANDSSLTSASVDMIASVTDDNGIANVTLYVDGTANETNTSQYNGTYTFTKTFAEGVHNWSLLAYDTDGLSTQSATRIFNYTQPPIFIDLLSPTDASTSQVAEVNVSCKAYEDAGVTQLNLTIDGVVNKTVTNSTVAQNLTLEQVTNFAEGNYTWGCSAINPTISAVSANRTFQVSYSSPVVVLLTPANDSSFAVSEITITFNATDINGIDNVKLYINGVLNETNSSGVKGDYSYTKNFSEGNYTWSVLATSTLNKETQSANKTFEILFTSPTVTLTLPANASTFLDSNITFTFTATDAYGIKNITLFLDGVVNKTNSSGVNGSYTYDINFSGGSHNWTVRAASIKDKITNSKRTFSIHATAPTVTITEPSGRLGYFLLGNNQTLTYNISEVGENSSHFDSCWYIYGDDNFCYQESTNISNQTGIDGDCNLDYSGTYSSSGVFTDWNNLIDGNWSTFGLASGVSDFRYSYVNYTKPSGATSESIWVVKSLVTEGSGTNVSISQTCWDYNSTTLLLRSKSNRFQDGAVEFRNVYWQCYDGSWNTLKEYVNIQYDPIHLPYNGVLYEEAINWNIVNIINCSETEVNFTYVDGVNSITVFAEDTYGLTSSSTSTWVYNLTEFSQTYPTSSLESATETYTANISYNNNTFNVVNGILTINGTGYVGTVTTSGSSAILTVDVEMPNVEILTNFTAYWTIGLTNVGGTTSYNLTSNNVSVDVINMSLCGAGFDTPFWNFTIINESNGVEINSTFAVTFAVSKTGSTSVNYFNYSDATGTNSKFSFCFDPSNESFTVDTKIELTKTGFAAKSYNFESIILTNTTREDNLYMLADDDSTSFIVHVVYTSGSDVTDAEVRVQRYYPGLNLWVTTEIITTNYKGEAISHILAEDANYRFLVYQDGVSIYTSSSTKIACTIAPCTVTLVIPITLLTGTEQVENLVTSLTYSSSTNIFTYTYTDSSSLFSNARLYVYRLSPSNASLVVPCNQTKTTAVGVITCDITGQVNGTYQASAYITRDEDEFLVKRTNGVIGSNIYDAMGNDGVLWAIFVFIGIIMLGIARPSLAIIFAVLGVIFLSLLGIINIGAISLIAIVALAIILLIRVGKE